MRQLSQIVTALQALDTREDRIRILKTACMMTDLKMVDVTAAPN